jgi:hypothetical protein
MSNTALDALIEKLRDTYESGKPVVAEMEARWQTHSDLLAMLRFMYTFSEIEAPLKQRVVEHLIQLSQDMDTAFALLHSYHGLTKVCVALAHDKRTEEVKV